MSHPCFAPIKSGHEAKFPTFVKQAVRKSQDLHVEAVEEYISRQLSGGLLDHWGSTNLYSGVPCLVAQPYSVTADRLRVCEEFAKANGLQFHCDPATWHNPGRTFALIFVPGDHDGRFWAGIPSAN